MINGLTGPLMGGDPANMFKKMMQPKKSPPLPSYLNKFVAGPNKLDNNPLNAPSRTNSCSSPSKQQ